MAARGRGCRAHRPSMPPRLAAHGEPELAAVLTIDDLTGMHREDLHATDGQRGCVGKAVVGRRPEHDGAIEREPGDVDRAQVTTVPRSLASARSSTASRSAAATSSRYEPSRARITTTRPLRIWYTLVTSPRGSRTCFPDDLVAAHPDGLSGSPPRLLDQVLNRGVVESAFLGLDGRRRCPGHDAKLATGAARDDRRWDGSVRAFASHAP